MVMKGSMLSMKQGENENEKLKQIIQKEELYRNKHKIFGFGSKDLDRNSICTLVLLIFM